MAAPFVDYYAVLGGTPETPAAELKKLYLQKVREFHPDKRPESTTGTGERITQELNAAWDILQDPAKREAYDAQWRQGRFGALSPEQRASLARHEGNELYKEAQAIIKNAGPESLTAAATSLHKYQAAIAKYSEGIELAPKDHRLYSNRALCYAAVKHWKGCLQDGALVTRMNPNFMKGWFLLAKAHWKLGQPIEAQRELESGLQLLPGNPELLALQADIAPDVEAARSDGAQYLPRVGGRAGVSRNVSPVRTPGVSRSGSRVATPPKVRGASRSPVAGGAPPPMPGDPSRGRGSSRSPGPAARDYADETAKFGENTGERTANFGGEASHASYRQREVLHARSERSASPRPPAAAPPRDPTPPRPGRGRSSLSGMVAASRVGIDRMG